ncbi:MAG: aminotransferase class I/II-fold pyridoxal phosphate-dependent enzyme [Planctomycetota bacterium]
MARTVNPTQHIPLRASQQNQPAISFGGCNYLALAENPQAIAAATRILRSAGLSTSASRTTTGDTQHHRDLEAHLEDFLSQPTILLPDGFTANIAACQALAKVAPNLTALIDARAHPSLTTAARAAGLPVRTYAHKDPTDLARRRPTTPIAVLTDGVFTADGALAPAPNILEQLGPDDVLLLDDCHALGTIGPAGRGTAHHFGLADPRIITTSTLAKAIAAAGGFVAARPEIIDAVRTAASVYVCTTPTPPALIAAARANLTHLQTHADTLLPKLHANAARLHTGLHNLGIQTAESPAPNPSPTPIAAFDLGQHNNPVALALAAAGIELPLMAYPGGPSQTYFRASVSAAHTAEDIDNLLQILTHATTRTPTT